jgi:Rod binding domain-containing protein
MALNGIHGIGGATPNIGLLSQSAVQQPAEANLQVKEKFQEFVAGTFYSQMLKALHKTHDKPAYFHGGQAEELFQSQMDQHVATELSKNHGASFSDPLFNTFQNQLKGIRPESSTQPPRAAAIPE